MDVKEFLSNSKMGKLVAKLIGKTELAVENGKVVLSAEEKTTITKTYGDAFLTKLESISFADMQSADTTHELFDVAVAHFVNEAKEPLQVHINSLQRDIATLAALPEQVPNGVDVTGAKSVLPIKLDMNAKHNAIVHSILSSGKTTEFASLENGQIDVTELNKEFNTVMPPNVRLELITKRMYNGFTDSKYMTRIQSNTDYIASDAIITEVSQEFTPKWTPKGTMQFTPIRIPYRRHKLNVLISPASVIKSWLLFLYEQGKAMQEMPITKYIVENHILPKVSDDITRSMIGKGKYEAAPASVKTGDAGRSASKSMDGYETILVDGKKSGTYKINYFKGAVNPYELEGQELLDYVDSFVDAIADFFVGGLSIHCAPQFLTHYQRADFLVNGKYTGESIGTSVRFTKFTFTPLESMYNSQILFATPKENFVELVDYSKAENCINKITEEDYDVKIFGEYSLSVGFKIGEAVFAAVPENYNPSDSVILETPAVDTATSKWTYGGSASVESEEESA